MGIISDVGGLFKSGGKRHSWNMMQAAFAENRFMSGTAYQRSTADLRKAGLNPILAYQQGGAATPGAPTPAGGGDTGGQVLGALTGAATSAIAAIKAKKEMNLIDQQTATASALEQKAWHESEFRRFSNARPEVEYNMINSARNAVTGSSREGFNVKRTKGKLGKYKRQLGNTMERYRPMKANRFIPASGASGSSGGTRRRKGR